MKPFVERDAVLLSFSEHAVGGLLPERRPILFAAHLDGIAVVCKQRTDECKQEKHYYHDKRDHGDLVFSEPAPCVGPVGNGLCFRYEAFFFAFRCLLKVFGNGRVRLVHLEDRLNIGLH